MSLRSAVRTVITLGRGVAAGLPSATNDRDPFDLFEEWFSAAKEAGILLPEAMTLATSTPDGRPSARQVLLKEVDGVGFVFYTNLGSRKAGELVDNPFAALCFHWPVLERQVRVEGRVERVTDEVADAYYQTRGRGSRIGAWASRQSEVLPERDILRSRVKEIDERFSGVDVPLPSFWGGFRLLPETIEFWQGRADRLHDRLRFRNIENNWSADRLYP